MTDRDFLIWLHERLRHVYRENELFDYMHKLRCVITSIPDNQVTPSDGRGKNGYKELMEALKTCGTDAPNTGTSKPQ